MSEDNKSLLQQWGPLIPVVLFLAAQGLIALKWASDQGATMRELTTFKASVTALGLDRPHRLAQYLAQLMHESMAFHYDREIWGPTTQQQRYERDPLKPWVQGDPRNSLAFTLGNILPGDGWRYRGRGPIMLTGRSNYRDFTRWCRAGCAAAPDFEAEPDAVLEDPWEGIVPIWYWMTRGLSELADANAIEAITRRINGGLNGYNDRRRYYHRTALVMLGYAPTSVHAFQTAAGLTVDGIAGQLTEAALHAHLVALSASLSDAGQPEPVPGCPEPLPALQPGPERPERRYILTIAADGSAGIAALEIVA